MKVALVHDYLKEIGGAERVLLALKEIWPEADVYTAYAFPEFWGHQRNILGKWKIKESWGSMLPFLPKFISYYTPLSPLFFSEMDLSGYDLVVISATGAYFPNGIHVGSETKVITYCHTPPRFLYGYETATRARYKWYWRPASNVVNHFLRIVDYYLAQKPMLFIANSKNVANRIRKFYRREATVVYPPIETNCGKWVEGSYKREDYCLIVSRIVGTKNIDLAVAAANKYKFKLKIAGKPIGKSGENIVKEITGDTVEYLGEVNDEKRNELLAKAKMFLALEKEADFGMTTVEPMTYGTPVVAFRAGGYLEIVREPGKNNRLANGYYFDELSVESLFEAITKVERYKWNRENIRKFAQTFSERNFKDQVLSLVNNIIIGSNK